MTTLLICPGSHILPAGAIAIPILALLLFAALPEFTHAAEPPGILNHQGRIAVDGVNYDGSGKFKFSLVNTLGNATYWSNDGTGAGGSEPTTNVSVELSKGHYSVLLGDTPMVLVPKSVFSDNAEVLLRIWFSSDDGATFEQLSPDRRIASVGYALNAGPAGKVLNVTYHIENTRTNLEVAESHTMADFLVNKKSATSVLICRASLSFFGAHSGSLQQGWKLGTGSEFSSGSLTYTGQFHSTTVPSLAIIEGHTTTGPQSIVMRYYSADGATTNKPYSVYNPNSTDDNRIGQTSSVFVIWEVEN